MVRSSLTIRVSFLVSNTVFLYIRGNCGTERLQHMFEDKPGWWVSNKESNGSCTLCNIYQKLPGFRILCLFYAVYLYSQYVYHF